MTHPDNLETQPGQSDSVQASGSAIPTAARHRAAETGTADVDEQFVVALIGNPNTGKSTIFNALSGLNQRTGNYPGVTIDKKIGKVRCGESDFLLIDLPGTYSLTPNSPDEVVAINVLTGRQPKEPAPNLVVCVLDASNLERNMFLCSQLLDMNLPVVVALNMMDVAERKNLAIDVERISGKLNVPVVPLRANRRQGLVQLKAAIVDSRRQPQLRPPIFESSILQTVAPVRDYLVNELKGDSHAGCHADFLARRMVLDNNHLIASSFGNPELNRLVDRAREELSQQGPPLIALESMARYRWIGELLQDCFQQPAVREVSLTDRIDRVLTHRLWGTGLFVALMLIVFQSIFSWAAPVMDGVDWIVGTASTWLTATMPEGVLKSLLADGVMAGVGSVIIFLPQIFTLFFFIALLEDCGYMARAAFLMDKLMCRIGLSGKSFIPLLSSFACAIPGIMAARVIENRRDRLITMLIAPLMSCSARLPVYVLLIAAFIPATPLLGGVLNLQGLTMFAMYAIGAVVAVAVAFALRKTILRGPTPPFVLELPDYKIPSLSNVLRRMSEQGWAFLRRAGTLIFSVSVVIWALAFFPRDPQVVSDVQGRFAPQLAALEDQIAAGQADREARNQLQQTIDNAVASAQLEQSVLGRAGKLVEPAVRPLGWDWKIASATIASFPAREVIVATLGVIYSVGADADEESNTLKQRLQQATRDGTDQKVYNTPVALSIMVFFALCAQCVSTLAIMKRETASWRWPIFTFVYMTTLAYVGALITYQVGMLF